MPRLSPVFLRSGIGTFSNQADPNSRKKTHQNKNLSSSNANIEAEGLIPARAGSAFVRKIPAAHRRKS
jgi:hypothetical protein